MKWSTHQTDLITEFIGCCSQWLSKLIVENDWYDVQQLSKQDSPVYMSVLSPTINLITTDKI